MFKTRTVFLLVVGSILLAMASGCSKNEVSTAEAAAEQASPASVPSASAPSTSEPAPFLTGYFRSVQLEDLRANCEDPSHSTVSGIDYVDGSSVSLAISAAQCQRLASVVEDTTQRVYFRTSDLDGTTTGDAVGYEAETSSQTAHRLAYIGERQLTEVFGTVTAVDCNESRPQVTFEYLPFGPASATSTAPTVVTADAPLHVCRALDTHVRANGNRMYATLFMDRDSDSDPGTLMGFDVFSETLSQYVAYFPAE